MKNLNEVKIKGKLLAGITSYQVYDGSINANYEFGIKESDESEFKAVISESIYIDSTISAQLINAPMTQDDLGKTPTEIMCSRIHHYLLEISKVKF